MAEGKKRGYRTGKQLIAMREILENPGISKAEAMRRAGYSPNTIKNPKDLTTSLSFEELSRQIVPDSDLVEVGRQGLWATKIHSSHTEPDQVVPDHDARYKYWKGFMESRKIMGGTPVTAIQINVNDDRGKYA